MSSSEDGHDSRSPSPVYSTQPASKISNNASEARSSIVSNVLSFVSRELSQFVVNATGGTATTMDQPVAGPSRERARVAPATEKRLRQQSIPSQPHHDPCRPKRVRRDNEDRHDHVAQHGPNEYPSRPSRSPPGHHRRRMSMTMPGSLFARSPTPEDAPDHASDRHVRFASNVLSPISHSRRLIRQPRLESGLEIAEHHEPRHSDEERDEVQDGESFTEQDPHSYTDRDYEASSSGLSSPTRGDLSVGQISPSPPRRTPSAIAGPSSHSQPVTRSRPPATPSVRDVIAKLDGDSPPRPKTPSWRDKGKGKARELEPPHVPWPTMSKENEHPRPRLGAESRLPSTVGYVEGARRVDAFLRHTAEDPQQTEDSILTRPTAEEKASRRRIRELEERVKSLEDELSRRPPPQRSDTPPPPPPPPLPPPLPSASTLRISLSSPRQNGVNSVLAQVRAGLKQTPGIPETSKAIPKNRLPTIPTDKMEAFLSELKTVRLRRVGSADDSSRSMASSSSGREYSQSSSQGSSMLDDRSTIGYKRKRTDSGNEAQSALLTSMKRRFTNPHNPTAISTSVSASSSRSFLPPPLPSTLAQRNALQTPAMPPETYGTTPSLCSDNDNDTEDRPPLTPPLHPLPPPASHVISNIKGREDAFQTAAEDVQVRAPPERYQKQETHTTLLHDKTRAKSLSHSIDSSTRDRPLPSTSKGRGSGANTVQADNPFSCRPPSSPIHPETPRRPRPPARMRGVPRPVPQSPTRSRNPNQTSDPDGTDSLSLSFHPPDESTPAPDPVGRRRQLSRDEPSRMERRLTLEEEIRRVDPSYSDEERAVNVEEIQRPDLSYSDEERAMNELESGVLVGVGRRSKRLGFLARGGAGGEPVMMGVGYIEGVLDEEQTKAAEAGKGKKKGKATAVGKRKPKR